MLNISSTDFAEYNAVLVELKEVVNRRIDPRNGNSVKALDICLGAMATILGDMCGAAYPEKINREKLIILLGKHVANRCEHVAGQIEDLLVATNPDGSLTNDQIIAKLNAKIKELGLEPNAEGSEGRKD